jgi:hypothetical protein
VIARSNFADSLTQDIRFAIRQLRKSPIFAATSILTLALGLCAAIAIFAFVDAALIRPLPYKEPSRLVGVFERVQVFPQSNLSYADYLDWKRLNTVFTSLAAYQGTGATLTTSEGVDRVPAARVSDDFFRTLGVVPALGRDLRPGEDLPEAPRAVLLELRRMAETLWRSVGCSRANRDAERFAKRDRRGAAARLSFRTGGARRFLAGAARQQSVRVETRVPQPVRRRAAS